MIDKAVFVDRAILESYLWNLAKIEEIESDGTRIFLSCEDVVDAHYLICNHFYKKGEGIGGFGPKDFGLLNSAVARQFASVGGSYVYNGIWEIAATLMFGLINNHPFFDANKRTAFLSSVFFLYENRYVPTVDVIEVEDFTVEIASSHGLTGKQSEISEIARTLRGMFRQEDRRSTYLVTYRELQTLLARHNCSMRDPDGNFIDLYSGEQRIAKLGFPGWSKQVKRGLISVIRKKTGLTAENGCDSAAFFGGADPLSELIGEYEEPLRRLADR